MILRPPISTLFPYTTLFRSRPSSSAKLPTKTPVAARTRTRCSLASKVPVKRLTRNWRIGYVFRSEEHTSELQSHSDLVCRLLLEKKKETVMQIRSDFHPAPR